MDPDNTAMTRYMEAALEQARLAGVRDEVPIGAVIVDPEAGEILSANGNRTIELHDPSAHAEMLCIRDVCTQKGVQRIPGLDLYVTLEPCTMCTAAISFARIRRLVIGALDEKGGGVISGVRFFESRTCHHKPAVVDGILADECGQILKDFFKAKRK